MKKLIWGLEGRRNKDIKNAEESRNPQKNTLGPIKKMNFKSFHD